MPLPANSRLGPYEILAPIGAGGMGEVYRARDTRLERVVAIKVMAESFAREPQALARFQREARAVAALSHPNVLTLYDIGSEQDRPYVVMELLEGQTLAARIKVWPLDWRAALDVAVAVADGLAAAHARGIIHRDIKPANIFLLAGGGVKVLDFGLARLETRAAAAAGPKSTAAWETQPGVVMGTVAYMPPEQLRGQTVDARTDLYALGCVLYEMLSGRLPFTGPTIADLSAAILHESPAPLPADAGRPGELDRLVRRCLEKEAERRPSSARDLAQALRELARRPETGEAALPRFLETTAYQETAGPWTPRATPSVAVLPFVNMSSDPENEYFGDGLAEELINALTRVEGLHVASRLSAFAFKGKNEEVRTIGERLNVRTVLSGSVRKAGSRLRIAAQLVNVADGYLLWSETFNRQLEDVFAIQDEIAQNIARALRVILTDKERRAIEKVPTADVRAYDCYLRGMQFFHQFRRRGFEYARQMFARAIAIDPGYARAHAGLADCHSFLYEQWEASAANLRAADESSRRALELDPDLAEGHVARGLYFMNRQDHDAARREFETALRLNPNLFEAYYFFGRSCIFQGKLAEAAGLMEHALRLRPDDYQTPGLLACVYSGLGKAAEAEAAYRQSLAATEAYLELHPDDARALYLGANAQVRLGLMEPAVERARRALAMEPDDHNTRYNAACIFALAGRVEEALDHLEEALGSGFGHKGWIENDSDLNALHGHPRYEALLQKL